MNCGNWDWGREVPFLGIFVSNFRYSVFTVHIAQLAQFRNQSLKSDQTWARLFFESFYWSPLVGWLVSALSIPIGENGKIPLLTLTLTTITPMQLQNKHASRPLHVLTTMQPQSKLMYVKCSRTNTNLWNKIKNQKSGTGHQIFNVYIRYLILNVQFEIF